MSVDAATAEGVRSTIARYAQALDDGRTDDLVATFCPDGVCELPGFGTFTGHAEIAEAFARWRPVKPQRHLVANTALAARSVDEVDAVSDLVFTVLDKGAWSIVMVGRYHDTFRRVGDQWLIARRATRFEGDS
ncbi:nuclear transport factor 2 family protein [Candidatus Poriferisocius sp.]|uniref:nuclear transport factor 2 family protein n=1 Tax=Candidatus Poriferisocius sp. TaxID=3101276 RepID=UPI003B5A0B22